MSRLAKKPIEIPNGVKFTVNGNMFYAEGPLGKIEQDFKPDFVEIKVDGNQIVVDKKGNTKQFKAFQGLYWKLAKNAVFGVSTGYKVVLKIVGVGYKWQTANNKLTANVGLSHPVEFVAPKGVVLSQDNPAFLTVSGVDKGLVGQVAANIRFIKQPEPYKGKGIRYENEVVKLKEGKSSAK